MGLAVGAVVSGLFALSLWQIPMVLIGVLVLISGPSVMWYRGMFAGLVG